MDQQKTEGKSVLMRTQSDLSSELDINQFVNYLTTLPPQKKNIEEKEKQKERYIAKQER